MLQRANADLDQSLAEARDQFAQRRPKSKLAAAQAEAVMPGGNTRTILYHLPFPLRAASGEGAMITDADGHAYVDLNGEYTAGVYGHSHPVIKDAVRQALEGGFNLAAHNHLEIRLAQLVCERFPAIERVRFTNSGTEANLMAIVTARIFTGRTKVMVFRHAYHGGLLHFGGGGLPTNVPFPFVVAPYNDIAGTRSLIREHARRSRLHPRRADDRRRRVRRRGAAVSADAAGGDEKQRRVAHFRRGDDVAVQERRRPGAIRHCSRPDLARQIHLRRHDRRGFRRARRHHGDL